MDYLEQFCKYNINLKHVNLSCTNLLKPALVYIGNFMRKAQSLRVMHLTGNPASTPEMGQWLRERIHAKPHEDCKRLRDFTHFEADLVSRHLEDMGANDKTRKWKNMREGIKI